MRVVTNLSGCQQVTRFLHASESKLVSDLRDRQLCSAMFACPRNSYFMGAFLFVFCTEEDPWLASFCQSFVPCRDIVPWCHSHEVQKEVYIVHDFVLVLKCMLLR